ncbi:MAG: RidA family protein [Ardenticatenaceae bacterium]|nr:RidA family protein [Ardenticatenaceae bacterium]HBY94066.1 hypothetical protein [Chloroflexota bacterium]
MSIEDRLKELRIELPEPPEPIASYVPLVVVGNLLFTSGNGPWEDGVFKYRGKLGSDLTVEEGYQAARLTMLNLLSVVKAELGNLDRVERVVKLLGIVASAPDFNRQPEVVNGASDLLEAIFRERGQHARSAIGTNELPGNIPIEIEMILQVKV